MYTGRVFSPHLVNSALPPSLSGPHRLFPSLDINQQWSPPVSQPSCECGLPSLVYYPCNYFFFFRSLIARPFLHIHPPLSHTIFNLCADVYSSVVNRLLIHRQVNTIQLNTGRAVRVFPLIFFFLPRGTIRNSKSAKKSGP